MTLFDANDDAETLVRKGRERLREVLGAEMDGMLETARQAIRLKMLATGLAPPYATKAIIEERTDFSGTMIMLLSVAMYDVQQELKRSRS